MAMVPVANLTSSDHLQMLYNEVIEADQMDIGGRQMKLQAKIIGRPGTNHPLEFSSIIVGRNKMSICTPARGIDLQQQHQPLSMLSMMVMRYKEQC